jgi:hypothetical protein
VKFHDRNIAIEKSVVSHIPQFGDVDVSAGQSWNRLENCKPVRSGRLKNCTGPVRPVVITWPTGEIPVKPVKNRRKNGEFFSKTIFRKHEPKYEIV